MNKRERYYLYLDTITPHYTPALESFGLAKRIARKLTKRGYHGVVCGFREVYDGLSWTSDFQSKNHGCKMLWHF